MQNNVVKYTLPAFLLGLIVALLLVIFFDNKINYEFGILDFINIVITIGLALYISIYFTPNNDNKKVEKELAIESLQNIREFSKNIFENYAVLYGRQISDDERKNIIIQFRFLSNKIYNFDVLVNNTHYLKNFKNYNRSVLVNGFFRYKREVTGGQFSNSNYIINNANYSRGQNAYNLLESDIQKIILDINKL